MQFFKVFVLFLCVMISSMSFANVSTLVADTKSGLILSAQNASEQKYPASLTKVMTLYLTFTAIDNGLLSMDDKIPVSLHAARQPRSKLYVKAGQTISVRDAIMALIIISANDVAVVLSEALAPSEEEFAQMMTDVAKRLGLKNTTFKNASGLHNPDQVTTAQDMAVLAMAMIHHYPDYYKLFSKKTFTYKGKTYKTHNHVQKKYMGAEGLKTGYISAVGYNIISTAKRDNHRLVSVVIGQNTIALRDKQAMNLLDKGFAKIKKQLSIFKRLKKDSNTSALNKKAVLAKPDMTPYLKIMATRLNKVVKTGSSANRRRLMALSPMPKNEEVVVESPLIAQGDIQSETEIKSAEPQKNDIAQQEETTQTLKEEINVSSKDETNVALKEEAIQTPKEESVVEVKDEIKVPDENGNTSADEILSQETETKVSENIQDVSQTPNHLKTTTINELAVQKETVLPQKTVSGWGIQVGAFASEKSAKETAQKALKILNDNKKTILIPKKDNFYRSRIFGFASLKQAKQACKRLKTKKMQCLELSESH